MESKDGPAGRSFFNQGRRVRIDHSSDSHDSWCNHLGTLIITDLH
jgi:hypothetical protein